MRFQMRVLVNRIFRKLTGLSFESHAASVTQLHPAESLPGRPAIFLETDVQKIQYVVNEDVEYQIRKALGGPDHHLPTLSYQYHRASIRGSYLLCGMGAKQFETTLGELAHDEHRSFSEAYFSTNVLSGLEFGHWVRDCLVAETYAQDAGLPSVAVGRQPWQHETGYRTLTEYKCIYGNNIDVNNLTILDDRGLNTFWAQRFLRVKENILKNLAGNTSIQYSNRLFIRRGVRARPREPQNVDAIADMLESIGFKTIVPTDMTISEIGAVLQNAKLVISAEGSHLNHLHYFCPANIKLIILQDPERFSVFHKRFVDLNDGILGFLVGDIVSRGVYSICLDNLRKIVDDVDRYAFYGL